MAYKRHQSCNTLYVTVYTGNMVATPDERNKGVHLRFIESTVQERYSRKYRDIQECVTCGETLTPENTRLAWPSFERIVKEGVI